MDITVRIGNKTLKNPVGVASGTFGYGQEYAPFLDINNLGAIYTKAITPEVREGNPTPRIVETPGGMLNAIGLANVGLDNFISQKLPFLKKYQGATIVNVAGRSEEDYCQVVERLNGFEEVWGYEINISCPNVKCGGISFGTDPVLVESLVGQLRKRTQKPLIIKLTPNVTDITITAKAAVSGGADALSCINTLKGMLIDTKSKKPVLSNVTGGLSGPAILPVGIALTYQVAKAVDIPIVGLGGIMTANDAIQYLLAGASAVQIGTANFVDPTITEQVLEGIINYMKQEKLEKIEDFHQFLLA
ncbi:dihydroorotate dehydrogenase [Spirochaeta cellobiosiphila]|uniref:dihydroorotate dehydrogenase n=1 Tax=Spirochaeta cellobiosiphila TaxID=504483 RepID=UPI0003FDA713|nr:dihydroorotate dehydrogenase [Spirochaeta cellobiosiphila]